MVCKKRLFESYEEAGKVKESLETLGLWTEIKNKQLPDKTGVYYYINVIGFNYREK